MSTASSATPTEPGVVGQEVRAAGYAEHARVRDYTESKRGYKTTEFLLTILFVAGVLIATYINDDDSLGREDGWELACFVVIAYVVSRGLAKLGVREPYSRREEP
jgi:hypothetical protein